MDNKERPRRILVPGMHLNPCTVCGEMLSSIDGNVFTNCNDWGEFALSQMKQPTSFSMVLPFLLMRKLCRLESGVAQQNSMIQDAIKCLEECGFKLTTQT